MGIRIIVGFLIYIGIEIAIEIGIGIGNPVCCDFDSDSDFDFDSISFYSIMKLNNSIPASTPGLSHFCQFRISRRLRIDTLTAVTAGTSCLGRNYNDSNLLVTYSPAYLGPLDL